MPPYGLEPLKRGSGYEMPETQLERLDASLYPAVHPAAVTSVNWFALAPAEGLRTTSISTELVGKAFTRTAGPTDIS